MTTHSETRLGSSIPANNQKIIELYNKLRSEQLIINPDYQRKLVWKKQHKIKFIDTILKNYPFPEVYLAQSSINAESLSLVDEIVDGQQRLMTIKDYIEGLDIFAMDITPAPNFNQLTVDQKRDFLNYEVSVRYLKDATQEQIREIFQRINKTDYSLNSTEKLNAQYGYSEFIFFAKQIIESDFNEDGAIYIMPKECRDSFMKFFHGDDDSGIFSDSDISRMQALQYIMTLVATITCGEYFSRNSKTTNLISEYNDMFPHAEDICHGMIDVIEFIKNLSIPRFSRWYSKSLLFTLMVELYKYDKTQIKQDIFRESLLTLEKKANSKEFEIEIPGVEDMTRDEIEFFTLSREAVNEKSSREIRGNFVREMIHAAIRG
ncbi:hypothetical protein CF111_15065 [Aeromonas sobria]|uniref:DUF262 domain-containing protein n=1 Tax=Aeromonas sobria TaxID=646 RepID=UPI00111ACE4C|nr:DUF262 domain-containing protein [Aeromonas sobria]TNJ20546.1 hypothetical protein CF111_15065 [Aeromonas sobria]